MWGARKAWFVAAAAVVATVSARAPAGADDGKRAIEVKRCGIVTRVPQAWNLIAWNENNLAFALKLPQDRGSKVGYVRCELGVAPERLEEYQERYQATAEREQKVDPPPRNLVENRIELLDEKRFGKQAADELGRRLLSVWEYDNGDDTRWYELRFHVIHEGVLYTFSLTSDEAHFDAYRLDLDDVLTTARFSPPETGLRRLPGGYWMQQDFRFALLLPEGWKPAFGPEDRVLFFATGKKHGVFTDNLLVLASPPRPLDLKELKEAMPAEIGKADPAAKVTCELVPQGPTVALETVIRTRRGSFDVTIIERRFSTQRRNYEVKFTCATSEFEQIRDELRKALDSFVEVPDAPAAET